MAVKGPKGPGSRPPLRPEAPAEEAPRPLGVPLGRRIPDDASDRRKERDEAAQDLTGEGRIGDPDLSAEAFAQLGTLVAARHLMALLARKRRDVPRAALLDEVGELLLAQPNSEAIRRILLQMGEVGRIVDIYPLEVLDWVLARRPALLRGFSYGDVILNKAELEARTFEVEEVIRIKVPLSLKMRAFALEGGGEPGYCFAPGPPAEYHLEIGEAGRYTILVRGDVRRNSLLDRAILSIEEGPDPDSKW